jgi:Protein of unknown function (DUF2690)
MSSWLKHIGMRGAVVLACLAPFFGISTGVADASSSSWYCGNACDEKNPQTYVATAPGGPSNYVICAADAITVSSRARDGGTLQLRYSPTCQTTWGRLYGVNRSVVFQQRYMGSFGWVTVDPGYEIQDPGYRNWGYMWNDHGVTLRACWAWSWYSKDTPVVCTGGY